MATIEEFYLNGRSGQVKIETCEISHPSFSKTYYVVRNAINGVTCKLEDSTMQFFEYYPLQIKPTGSDNDLDQSMKVSLGDLGMLVPGEIDRCRIAGTLGTKPVKTYRTYGSDDLTTILDGPDRFVVSNAAFNQDGATLQCDAPYLNNNRTGELYSLNRFTPLRGF